MMDAIQDQNLEAAPGKFGEGSKEAYEYVIKYDGKLNKKVDYENFVIRANPDGSVLHLKDVASVEFGSYTYNSENKYEWQTCCNNSNSAIAGFQCQ